MYTLITLPYTTDALEPVISAKTLEYHHGKHLQTYVDNLNKLLSGSGLEDLPLEEIVRQSSGAIFNNAGQVLNHELYFTQFAPIDVISSEVEKSEVGEIPNLREFSLIRQIEKQWGSLTAFKSDFESKGAGLFGSGWVWLSSKPDGTLVITQEPGASNPVVHGFKPLLTFDVWEHAYYLDYQNRRAAHLAELWRIVDWSIIEKRYYQ
ncbi:MAG: superoxide dismutase [Bacteroidales bacterium]|nr:superoxide dismutase [Bacteroidales bacterium]